MFKARLILATALAAVTLLPAAALAEISPDEAARLGQDLTPFGAIRAGNEAGTIPAWEGGLKSPADAGFPDFKTGGHHPDPNPIHAADLMADAPSPVAKRQLDDLNIKLAD